MREYRSRTSWVLIHEYARCSPPDYAEVTAAAGAAIALPSEDDEAAAAAASIRQKRAADAPPPEYSTLFEETGCVGEREERD